MARSSQPALTPGAIAGTLVGLILILIPEPATTLTGGAITAAIWAPRVLGKGGK